MLKAVTTLPSGSETAKNGGSNMRKSGQTRKNIANMSVSVITDADKTTRKPSERNGAVSITVGRKNTGRGAATIMPPIEMQSLLGENLDTLGKKLPVLFGNSSLGSPEGKLASLSLLDDMLMSLSLAADSLQKRMTRESEMHSPETVQALALIAKEIRSGFQVKMEVAKQMASLEFRKIRMLMEIEKHQMEAKNARKNRR